MTDKKQELNALLGQLPQDKAWQLYSLVDQGALGETDKVAPVRQMLTTALNRRRDQHALRMFLNLFEPWLTSDRAWPLLSQPAPGAIHRAEATALWGLLYAKPFAKEEARIQRRLTDLTRDKPLRQIMLEAEWTDLQEGMRRAALGTLADSLGGRNASEFLNLVNAARDAQLQRAVGAKPSRRWTRADLDAVAAMLGTDAPSRDLVAQALGEQMVPSGAPQPVDPLLLCALIQAGAVRPAVTRLTPEHSPAQRAMVLASLGALVERSVRAVAAAVGQVRAPGGLPHDFPARLRAELADQQARIAAAFDSAQAINLLEPRSTEIVARRIDEAGAATGLVATIDDFVSTIINQNITVGRFDDMLVATRAVWRLFELPRQRFGLMLNSNPHDEGLQAQLLAALKGRDRLAGRSDRQYFASASRLVALGEVFGLRPEQMVSIVQQRLILGALEALQGGFEHEVEARLCRWLASAAERERQRSRWWVDADVLRLIDACEKQL
ncbi:MAG TPA: hypothetical protein VEH84_11050 [Alphaproteobacteria bacterium]|nr:hypothetical protein [Alphaproteobacteria bacterium]